MSPGSRATENSGVMKKYAVEIEASAVDIRPAAIPPYTADTMTARKNKGEADGRMSGHRIHVTPVARRLVATGSTKTLSQAGFLLIQSSGRFTT